MGFIIAYTFVSILYVLLAHYIADFLCQTREMANNKSKSIKWLSLHVLTYGTVLGLSVLLFFGFTKMIFLWLFINVILHWMTDFITSKITTRLYLKEKWGAFFNVIGLDQYIHTLCLLSTLMLYFLYTHA